MATAADGLSPVVITAPSSLSRVLAVASSASPVAANTARRLKATIPRLDRMMHFSQPLDQGNALRIRIDLEDLKSATACHGDRSNPSWATPMPKSGWQDLNLRPRGPEPRALNQAELHPVPSAFRGVG